MRVPRSPLSWPEPVKLFVEAMIANAKKVEGWDEPSLIHGSVETFADSVVYVKRLDDGNGNVTFEVMDNYERFFDRIYRYDPANNAWQVRWCYSEREPIAYTFERAMLDASIMFTG